MAEAGIILDRIRSFGANVVLEGEQLRLVNSRKLPPDARNYLAMHRDAIAAVLRQDQQDAFEERAAIIEFDGGAPREWAEQFAKYLFQTKPKGVNEIDWAWFIDTCGRMIDEAPERSAA